MRKTLRASLLLLVLSCSAQAGLIPNDKTPPPPPPSAEAEPGLIPNDNTDDGAAEGIVLSLVQNLLALL